MQLLAEVARHTGAAVDFDGALSFAELRATAGALGAELRRRGVEPGDRVALLLPHGRLEPAVVLGIWAAGCVAVPLDLHLPLERIASLLERTSARLLIAAGVRGGALGKRLGWRDSTLLVGAPGHWRGARLEELPAADWAVAERGPDDVASILFTSGSTGTPKGVTITRGHVDAFTGHWARATELAPGDRVAHASDLAFDLSLYEVGATLRAGATVVPVPEGLLAFRGDLARWVESQLITHWYSVPTLVVGMVQQGLDPAALKVVLYAGEAMGEVDAVAVRRALPDVRLWNLFGPTETNVSCAWELPSPLPPGPVPIGRPCPYLEVRLHGGEILARGATVTPGYWGEPERATWLELDGERWLRTGDAAHWDGDVLRFDGRLDRMIKVSGYRVEPGAVEAALMRAGATEAAVFVRDGTLCAAVVGEVDPEDLGRAASSTLPSFSVPASIEVFDALPRTPRGKVDVAALKAPGTAR